jgi:hypothetical protein
MHLIRRCLPLLFCFAALSAEADSGRVIKVLEQFLDQKGRHMLNPSLFERDAYQAWLRLHPKERSGVRFDVEYRAPRYPFGSLKIQVEVRGIAHGEPPKEIVLEQDVKPCGWFSRWTTFRLSGQEYDNLGEVTAWRVRLWEDEDLLGEQQSFLW